MRFTIEINMANAAFRDSEGQQGAAGAECARILRKVATNVEESDLSAGYAEILRDGNGNVVGEAKTKRSKK